MPRLSASENNVWAWSKGLPKAEVDETISCCVALPSQRERRIAPF
jgi:hypothetical protein